MSKDVWPGESSLHTLQAKAGAAAHCAVASSSTRRVVVVVVGIGPVAGLFLTKISDLLIFISNLLAKLPHGGYFSSLFTPRFSLLYRSVLYTSLLFVGRSKFKAFFYLITIERYPGYHNWPEVSNKPEMIQ
jgi:hypothetical protein